MPVDIHFSDQLSKINRRHQDRRKGKPKPLVEKNRRPEAGR